MILRCSDLRNRLQSLQTTQPLRVLLVMVTSLPIVGIDGTATAQQAVQSSTAIRHNHYATTASNAPANADPIPPFRFRSNGVTAHRGNSGQFPENTMPAFRSGMKTGADWIELDILLTKDGQLVVIHDTTTGRVGDKDLVVAESTYAELATVDVATDFRRRHQQSIHQQPPLQIPRLQDVLAMVMQQQESRVSLQPKADCVTEAIQLIRNMQAERWVGFNDGHLPYMAKVKQLAPQIPVFWDRGANTDIDHDIRIAAQHGFESIVLHHSGVTAEKVAKLSAAGIEVGTWTVNDRDTMLRLQKLGVHRLYTDAPAVWMEIQNLP